MKTVKYFGLLVFIFLAINCKKNDDTIIVKPEVIDKPEPEPENQAPGSFALLEVGDGSTAVDLMPGFSWNTATDPDGDMVKYDLFLFKNGSDILPENKIAMDLNTTLFQLENSISLATEYDWYVIAKDGKGKETASDTYSFTTRNLNVPETSSNSSTDFSPRAHHTVTYFQDKLWLLGGEDEDKINVDAYSSSDGHNWNEGLELSIGPLSRHTTIAFRDSLWVFGGRVHKTGLLSPWMWYTTSSDKTMSHIDAPWLERELHTSIVFKDKAWVLGGIDSNGQPLNDVLFTEDVKTWDPDSNDVANWDGRYGHSSVVFDDKLWVIGGYNGTTYLNEVWYTDGTTSADGTLKWEFVPQENSFPGRLFHQTVVHDNKIWLLGGSDASEIKNDVWYSEDGANWVPLTQDAKFTGRIRPTLTAFENKLFMIGGYDGTEYHNKVWVFD